MASRSFCFELARDEDIIQAGETQMKAAVAGAFKKVHVIASCHIYRYAYYIYTYIYHIVCVCN